MTGISTPLVQRAGLDVGPVSTAALLYAGAGLIGALLRRAPQREARLQRADLGRIGWISPLETAAGVSVW